MSAITDMLANLPRGKRGPKATRLADSLTQSDDVEQCWPWQGRLGTNGYGIAVLPGKRTAGTTAHRLVWELLHGAIPDGYTVDHLCHDPDVCKAGSACPHRACVNPQHLAAVPARENTLRSNGPSAVNTRKTECGEGHAFTPFNTFIDRRGRRACRTCQRAYWRRRDAK